VGGFLTVRALENRPLASDLLWDYILANLLACIFETYNAIILFS